MASQASDPSPLPPDIFEGSVAHKMWRGVECRARGTLLVHGSFTIKYLKNAGAGSDPKTLLSRMVEAGVLLPCQVDVASSDPLTLQFKSLSHIKASPWCTDHALFWTYKPGNTTPMKEWFE